MLRPPPISTLFPYTTLFRSALVGAKTAGNFKTVRVLPSSKVSSFNEFEKTAKNRRSNPTDVSRSEEHTSELQSRPHLVCRLLLEKKKKNNNYITSRRQNDSS